MKNIIIAFLAFSCLITGIKAAPNCKTRTGRYYLTGILYSKKDGKILSNTDVMINDAIIKTDSLGRYVYIVQWESECRKPIRVFPRHKNKDIYFSYQNKKRKVKNVWKKYALPSSENPPSLTQRKDIYF